MFISPTGNKFIVSQEFGMTDFAKKGSYGRDRNGNLRIHTGVDYSTPVGTKIYAPISGFYFFKNEPDGYGLHIKIRTNNEHALFNWEVVLAHLSKTDKPIGTIQWYNVGDYVGETGDTGFSTNPHLHYGTRMIKYSKVETFTSLPINYNDNNYGYIDPTNLTIKEWKL